MGTLFVLVILVVIVALIIRSMILDKKKGKSLQCGGNCSSCGHCHFHS
ncbi:MAG: FeoB-associated Cys-rich membrane protein [Acetatifactor sp.]|nr:FeoB-associated Cys-rich membrane protein [Acetatifactor sp.]